MLDFDMFWKIFGKIKKSDVPDQNCDNAKNRRAVFEADGFVVKNISAFSHSSLALISCMTFSQGCHSEGYSC